MFNLTTANYLTKEERNGKKLRGDVRVMHRFCVTWIESCSVACIMFVFSPGLTLSVSDPGVVAQHQQKRNITEYFLLLHRYLIGLTLTSKRTNSTRVRESVFYVMSFADDNCQG